MARISGSPEQEVRKAMHREVVMRGWQLPIDQYRDWEEDEEVEGLRPTVSRCIPRYLKERNPGTPDKGIRDAVERFSWWSGTRKSKLRSNPNWKMTANRRQTRRDRRQNRVERKRIESNKSHKPAQNRRKRRKASVRIPLRMLRNRRDRKPVRMGDPIMSLGNNRSLGRVRRSKESPPT
jgi:hypothetical protein